MCIHYQPGRNGQQDQCVVNQWDDYRHHREWFHYHHCAILRRAYPCRKGSLRHCKRGSKDCEPHKAEEPNDVFTPVEYSAHAKEEGEGCSGGAYDIQPGKRPLSLLATSDWCS